MGFISSFITVLLCMVGRFIHIVVAMISIYSVVLDSSPPDAIIVAWWVVP